MDRADPLRDHAAKAVLTLALLALGLVLWKLSELLVLVFGAVVAAVLLRALAAWVMKYTRLPSAPALALVLVLLLAGLALLLWLFGSQVAAQLETLRKTLPAAWAQFQDWADGSPVGPLVRDMTEQAQAGASDWIAHAGALALSATGGIASVFLVIVGGIYFAAQPALYRRGLLKLVPARSRDTVADAFDASGHALKLWLGGQLLAMAMVGVLTGIGLWLLDVPVAFGLALIAALLDFVPIIGPFVAAIPAVLLGFTVSPEVGLATALLFLVVQQIEGNVLQPLIQQRAVDLPPALLLFSLFGIGVLFGLPGVLLAAPLTVVLYVLVKRLYVQEALDTDTSIPGRDVGQ